jgi:hypothetical protein
MSKWLFLSAVIIAITFAAGLANAGGEVGLSGVTGIVQASAD